MYELLHDVDFFQGLVNFKGVDINFFECKRPIFAILHPIHTSETSFSYVVHLFVFVHVLLSDLCDYNDKYLSIFSAAFIAFRFHKLNFLRMTKIKTFYQYKDVLLEDCLIWHS